ncbi:unnamed protein product, partial [Rotaria sp. Silwood1]
MISSNEGDVSTTDAILDRFCSDIIPRIHNNMESLTVQASLLQRVLHANSYPNLHKLTLVNLKLSTDSHIFDENLLFDPAFKHQISELIIKSDYQISSTSEQKFLADVYVKIFVLLPNLKYFDSDVHYLYYFSQALTSDLSFAKYCSSNIAYLRMKMHYFDDCLYLLDGRLSQLHTFIVDLNHIHEPSAIHLSPSRLIRNSLKLINNA